ncbi:MAG: DUF1365 domain-containing protein [Alphaproteobacteria bacterium]|nr:DUF1365 domain-containing protein [Alphaproteobacteria bacterium]
MAVPGTGSCVYFGTVAHKRTHAPRHKFAYGAFALLLDLDEMPALAARCRLFGHNRGMLYAFHDSDHGPRDGGSLRLWIEARASAAGIDLAGGAIRLLCLPRQFGYVFNPLSVWFCHDRSGALRAVLHEVRNTFGDKHGYLIPVPTGTDAAQPFGQSCAKGFHVSPFLGPEGRYRFRLHLPDERLSVAIRLDAPSRGSAGGAAPAAEGRSREALVATWTGERRPFSDATLAAALFRFPLMTLKVIAGIHWEALQLWRKGATFHRRPAPPASDVSYG